MGKLGYRMYCRRCKKLVNVYECHREEKVLPQLAPVFDLVSWCCPVCYESIVKVTELHKD